MPQPRKSKRGFVITSRVADHILDEDFENAFTAMNIGNVRYIKRQTVKADEEVDKKITPMQNDIRVIILDLPLNTEVKDIPANIKIGETNVPLFFKGKVLNCRKCKQKHANIDPCAIENAPETVHTPVPSVSPAVLLKEENRNIPTSEEPKSDNNEAKNATLSRSKSKKPAFIITCKVALGEQPVSDKAIKAAIVALNIGKVRYMKKQTIKCDDETKGNQSKIDTGMRVIVIDLPLYIDVKDIPEEIEIDKVCIPLFFKGKISKSVDIDEFEDLGLVSIREEIQKLKQQLQKEPFVLINTPDVRKEDTVVVSISQESNEETDNKENSDETKAVPGANAYTCIAGATTKKKKKKKKKKSKQ